MTQRNLIEIIWEICEVNQFHAKWDWAVRQDSKTTIIFCVELSGEYNDDCVELDTTAGLDVE